MEKCECCGCEPSKCECKCCDHSKLCGECDLDPCECYWGCD